MSISHNTIEKKKKEAFQQFLVLYSQKDLITTADNTVSIKDNFELLLENALAENEEQFQHLGDKLIKLHINSDVPYIVMINELSFIKNKLIHILLGFKKIDDIIELCNRFDSLEVRISQNYLSHYIKSLQTNINLRLESLSELAEDDIIHHYGQHVKWLYALSEAIHLKDPLLIPEKDPSQCCFGKWLLRDAKTLIINKKKYNKIIQLHQNLHLLGHKIFNNLENFDESSHACATYLEKADLISMEIGIELMLVDNMRTIARAAKDCLTGALNRSVLESIYYNQYEIAFATHSRFVFAMCDLDHFKNINDDFGHIAGDAVLKSFANLLKNTLRASDIIIRFGGEEFVIILPTLDYSQGREILTSFCNKVQHQPVQFEDNFINVTVSFGMIEVIPQFHSHESILQSLYKSLKLADEKLYLAKDNGRNRVE
jgi:diguanylate cyclase